MRMIVMYIWQLPQNILGLLLVWLYGAHRWSLNEEYRYFTADKMPSGISLGEYIILNPLSCTTNNIKHEYGHQLQSRRLGWLYLLVIGIPSLLGNLYSRLLHKDSDWYYSQPWEKWADKLGKVDRNGSGYCARVYETTQCGKYCGMWKKKFK